MQFRRLIYVQVHRGYFLARLFRGSNTIRRECPALLHPRTLAGNFDQIVSSLADILKEFRSPWSWLIKPRLLVHLVPSVEGGYTSIELRGFKQAGEQAGASFCWLCDDRQGPLTDTQLLDLSPSL